MVKPKTVLNVKIRTNGKCSNPKCNKNGAEIHHCHFKNDYKWDDRDDEWNLAYLCTECHNLLHGRIVGRGKDIALDILLKHQADIRKEKLPPKPILKISDDLIRLRKQRKNIYKKQLEIFKDLHEGLSPLQYQRKLYKQYSATYNQDR